uniref:Uncharacterized protein n=1 Tax=Magallana gigas TaxID=29159 RepID=A0A8W8MQU6_MAGGI
MADEAVSDAAISSPEVAAVGGDKQTTATTEPEKKVTMARLNFSEECGGDGEEEEGEGLGTELSFWLIEVNGLQTLSASSVMQM